MVSFTSLLVASLLFHRQQAVLGIMDFCPRFRLAAHHQLAIGHSNAWSNPLSDSDSLRLILDMSGRVWPHTFESTSKD